MKTPRKLKEGWYNMPPINKERYVTRDGLEGPFQTKAGKVVYYDPKEGSYYDPDSDMYISYDDYRAMNEDAASTSQKYVRVSSSEFERIAQSVGAEWVYNMGALMLNGKEIGYREEVDRERDRIWYDHYILNDYVTTQESGLPPHLAKFDETIDQINENPWNQRLQKKPGTFTLPAPPLGSVTRHGQKFRVGDVVVPHTGPHAGVPHKVTWARIGSVNIDPLVSVNNHKYDTTTVRARHEDLSPYTASIQKEGDFTPDVKSRLGRSGEKRLLTKPMGTIGSKDVTPKGYGPGGPLQEADNVHATYLFSMSKPDYDNPANTETRYIKMNFTVPSGGEAHPQALSKQIRENPTVESLRQQGFINFKTVAVWQGDLEAALSTAQERLASKKRWLPSYANQLKKTVNDLGAAKIIMGSNDVMEGERESNDLDGIIKNFLNKQPAGIAEAGPFNYGNKKPRRGSVAANAAEQRKKDDRSPNRTKEIDSIGSNHNQVGNAKVTKQQGMVEADSDPCWDDYKQVGMKTKNGRKVPNCVPKDDKSTLGKKTPVASVYETQPANPFNISPPIRSELNVKDSIKKLESRGWVIYTSRVNHRALKDFRLELEKDNLKFEIIGNTGRWELYRNGPTMSGRGEMFDTIEQAVNSVTQKVR